MKCRPARTRSAYAVDTHLLLAHTLDLQLDLALRTQDELLDTIDRRVADDRRLKSGTVAERLRNRHLRQSPLLGGGVALLNAEIRHLRRSRLLYLRPTQALTLGPQQSAQDFFVLLAAYPANLYDHSLLEYLRNNLPQRSFLQELRSCSGSDTVRAMLQRFLAPMGSGWLAPS